MFSLLRARLASFEHAYRIAIRLRGQTGDSQYVIETGDPIRPVRVISTPPPVDTCLLVVVI